MSSLQFPSLMAKTLEGLALQMEKRFIKRTSASAGFVSPPA